MLIVNYVLLHVLMNLGLSSTRMATMPKHVGAKW